jgi:hypothetical protein
MGNTCCGEDQRANLGEDQDAKLKQLEHEQGPMVEDVSIKGYSVNSKVQKHQRIKATPTN